jgi:muramoyltetrapeptide carboxypeptidase
VEKSSHPQPLQQGDTVGIVSTARHIPSQKVEPAVQLLKKWGLSVKTGKTIGAQHHQWAGTAQQRARDFQQMLEDPEVRAILCARGGNGTLHVVDRIDFSPLQEEPKWIAGFSDVTVLHSHIHTTIRLPTLHSIMPLNFPAEGKANRAVKSLKKALFGEKLTYTFPHQPLNRQGSAQARLVGGNFSTLYSLIGSQSEPNYAGKILFIEEVDEHLYHFDRMLLNLKRAGKLERLKGLAVGGLTKMKDDTPPYGFTAKELVLQAVEEYDYPLAFGVPAGHIEDNRALQLGAQVTLKVGEKETELRFD